MPKIKIRQIRLDAKQVLDAIEAIDDNLRFSQARVVESVANCSCGNAPQHIIDHDMPFTPIDPQSSPPPKLYYMGMPFVRLDMRRLSGPSKYELARLYHEQHNMVFKPDEFHDPYKFRFIYPRDNEPSHTVFWVVLWDEEKAKVCDA